MHFSSRSWTRGYYDRKMFGGRYRHLMGPAGVGLLWYKAAFPRRTSDADPVSGERGGAPLRHIKLHGKDFVCIKTCPVWYDLPTESAVVSYYQYRRRHCCFARKPFQRACVCFHFWHGHGKLCCFLGVTEMNVDTCKFPMESIVDYFVRFVFVFVQLPPY
jgi:hypothetical protein